MTVRGAVQVVASWPVDDARRARIVAATASLDGAQWKDWLSLVEWHRLVPHAFRQLGAAGVAPPSRVWDALSSVTQRAAIRALALLRQQRALADVLRGAGIPALAYKGPSLAVAAYGDVAARTSSDLDIVVTPSDVGGAIDAIRRAGYVSRHGMSSAHEATLQSAFGHFAYVHPDAAAPLELHWRFAPRRYPWQPAVDDVMRRAVADPAGSGLLAPEPHDSAILQATHGARHLWGALEWLVAFAATRAPLDAGRLAERAAGWRAMQALAFADLAVARLLGDGGGDGASPRLAGPLAAVEAASWAPAHAAGGDRLIAQLMDRRADRVRYWVLSAVTPTPSEWETVRLPASMRLAYYPLRLIRLGARALARR